MTRVMGHLRRIECFVSSTAVGTKCFESGIDLGQGIQNRSIPPTIPQLTLDPYILKPPTLASDCIYKGRACVSRSDNAGKLDGCGRVVVCQCSSVGMCWNVGCEVGVVHMREYPWLVYRAVSIRFTVYNRLITSLGFPHFLFPLSFSCSVLFHVPWLILAISSPRLCVDAKTVRQLACTILFYQRQPTSH
ncbi:hypothetical protein BD289DRAFT_189826 [Coniella lustricola]|uniref:Uncharacterized protein n=1 Tax=Coniella lustricola TaxID=2025994 RepID=A0A2T3ACY1_9PEZI|nr:hypothetical protein BD289DRAFT_189826 [Coniella lustricola]